MSEKNDNDMLIVGVVTGAHGRDGDLRIVPFTNSMEGFSAYTKLFIEDKEYPVLKMVLNKGKFIVTLEGIDDRSYAETFRDKEVSILRSQTSLEEDEYLVADIIGTEVVDSDNKRIGTIKDVVQTSGDIDDFIIETENKDIMVPARKEYFEITDEKIIARIPDEYFQL